MWNKAELTEGIRFYSCSVYPSTRLLLNTWLASGKGISDFKSNLNLKKNGSDWATETDQQVKALATHDLAPTWGRGTC